MERTLKQEEGVGTKETAAAFLLWLQASSRFAKPKTYVLTLLEEFRQQGEEQLEQRGKSEIREAPAAGKL